MRLFVVLAKRCSCRDIPRKPLLYELFFCLRGWRNVWKMFFLMAKIAFGWYDDTPFRVIFSWFLTHIGGAIFPKIISSLQAKKYIFLAEALRVTFKGIPLGKNVWHFMYVAFITPLFTVCLANNLTWESAITFIVTKIIDFNFTCIQ